MRYDNDNFEPVGDVASRVLAFCGFQGKPIYNLYASIKNRLRMSDVANQHDPIGLRPVDMGEHHFEAQFQCPNTGKSYKLFVMEAEKHNKVMSS